MNRLLLGLILIFLLPWHSFAQESGAETHTGPIPLNYRIKILRIGLNESRNNESSLELVEDQRKALSKLGKDFRRIEQSGGSLPVAESNALWSRKVSEFEESLANILLPHQRTELGQMVFTKLVKNYGSVIPVLLEQFPKQFKLSDDQLKQLGEIGKTKTEKLTKAKQEFQEKFEKIEADAHAEFHEILSAKQRELAKELANRLKQIGE